MAEQVRRADSTEGDIDALSHRIAQIRTWTFVSNRPGWLADPAHWQKKTREIEDRLSDALHDRLTKRFVDRRTSVLMRRLRENTMPEAEISPSGTVLVEGHHVGELQGFRFTADQTRRRRGRQGGQGRRAKGARRGVRNPRGTLFGLPQRRHRARLGWRPALDRRAHRHAGRRRGSAAAPHHPACRRAAYRPGARQGRGPRRALRELPDRYAAQAADRFEGRRPDRGNRPRRRLPAGREFRADEPARHRRGHQGARPGRAGRASSPWRAFRRLSHLRPGARQAGAGRADHAALGPEE